MAGALGSALLRERGDRDEIRSVSTRFAAALLSYDSADLDGAIERMEPLATERFLANYEATLKALARVNSRAEGRAVEVMVGEPAPQRVAVVVVTESTAHTANGPRASRGAHLRLDLVNQDGRWRVDQVLELAAGRSEGAEPPPGEG